MVTENDRAENQLRDHAARLRLIRAGRQLQHLLGALTPDCHAALGDLPPGERRDAAARYDVLHRAAEAFAGAAERLIDASPLANEPVEQEAAR